MLKIRPLGNYPFQLEFERTSSLLDLQNAIRKHMLKHLDNTFDGKYKVYLQNECLNDFDDVDVAPNINEIESRPLSDFGIIDCSELTIEKDENKYILPKKEINRKYSNVMKQSDTIYKSQQSNNVTKNNIEFTSFDIDNKKYYKEYDDDEELKNNYHNKFTIPTPDNLMIKAMKPYYPHMHKPHMNPELFPEYDSAMKDIDIINKQRKLRLMRNDIIV